MSVEQYVSARSNNLCELCGSSNSLVFHNMYPHNNLDKSHTIHICEVCDTQINKKNVLDVAHWQCLTTSMWSEVPSIQVMSWRMLNRLKQETWAQENLEMMFLEDNLLAWAKESGDHVDNGELELHRDSNGNVLLAGDTIVIIKSLDVKGSTVNAKMGTVVKNIRLVEENKGQIEGRIEGQTIVILTKYVRKG